MNPPLSIRPKQVGKGLVVAMPDPAYYNEYINLTDNYKAATNLLKYVLRQH